MSPALAARATETCTERPPSRAPLVAHVPVQHDGVSISSGRVVPFHEQVHRVASCASVSPRIRAATCAGPLRAASFQLAVCLRMPDACQDDWRIPSSTSLLGLIVGYSLPLGLRLRWRELGAASSVIIEAGLPAQLPSSTAGAQLPHRQGVRGVSNTSHTR